MWTRLWIVMSIPKDLNGVHDTELQNIQRWDWRERMKINSQEVLSEEMN